MTRKELLHWAEETVNRIFHGYSKTSTLHGWIVRDKDGSLFLASGEEKIFKDKKYWLSKSGMIKIPNSLFGNVRWEDEKPTSCEITIRT